MKKLLLLTVLVPLVAFAAPMDPGMIVTSTSKDLKTGETWSSTMSVQGEDLAMEFADPRSGASGSMVFLGGTPEWIMNDDQNRRYIRMTEADIDRLGEQMKAMLAQVEQMLEQIPAGQREAIMKAGGGAFPGMELLESGGLPVIEMRETGETDTKMGYPVERLDMYVGERRTQEMWVTDWSNVKGVAEVRTVFAAFANMMKSFLEAMPSSMFGEGGMANFMDFDRGVPIVSYELDEEGNPTVETVTDSFEEADIDRGIFGPKPGYTEQEIEFGR